MVILPSVPGPEGPPELACADQEYLRAIEGDFSDIRSTITSQDGNVVINGARTDTPDEKIWYWRGFSPAVELVASATSARARAVSADGTTVLGEDTDGDFLWRDGTVTRLPFDRQPWDCTPRASRDGQSIAGCLERGTVLIRGDTVTQLQAPAGTDATLPLAINRDGTAIAGLAYTANGAGEATNVQAMIWTNTGGARILSVPSGYDRARAIAVSDDGKRALLLARAVTTSNQTSVFRWVDGKNVELLGAWTKALATPDGNTVVGVGNGGLIHWTELTGPIEYSNSGGRVLDILELSADGNRGLVRLTTGLGDQIALWDWLLGWRKGGSSLSPDGRFLVTAARCDGRLRAVRVDLEQHSQLERGW